MQTDYQKLSKDDFVDIMKRYAVFKVVGAIGGDEVTENNEDDAD